MGNEVALIAYIPVIHRGYMRLLEKYAQEDPMVFVLDAFFLEGTREIDKDIRALPPMVVASLLSLMGANALVLSREMYHENFVSKEGGLWDLIMPEDDISRMIAEKYFPHYTVTFDTSQQLRWDKTKVTALRTLDEKIASSSREEHVFFMQRAMECASRSLDWWRRVGVCVVHNGREILSGHNTHLPSYGYTESLGDPRLFFKAGQHTEYTHAIHGELFILSVAARNGVALEGCDIYVTTFPCPACARALAMAGVKSVLFREGYSSMDALEVLTFYGVEVLRVVW